MLELQTAKRYVIDAYDNTHKISPVHCEIRQDQIVRKLFIAVNQLHVHVHVHYMYTFS